MAYDSVFKPGLFAGQTILVTGGGSGIGRCVAHELAYLGAHVVLVGRKLEKLESTCAEIVEDGGSASSKVCDTREEEAVKAMVAQVLAERERIHHLVNNAGGQFPAPLISINQKGFETRVGPNLVGGVLVGRVASIRFDTEIYRAGVELEVDKRYAFPADTTASILTSGLLGEQYVGLGGGADTAMLESGDRVLITQSAVVLEKLIGQFMFDRAADAPPAQ